MESLDAIGLRCGTDQSSASHDYLRTLEEFFAPLRDHPIVIMEQGIMGGAGIRTWDQYFTHPDTKIIGVDLHDWAKDIERSSRVRLEWISQTDAPRISRIGQECGGFDIVIDDASHFASQQFRAFEIGWYWIKPGGYWAVEDCHTWASPQHCDAPLNVMQWVAQKAESIQGRGPTAEARRLHGDSDIEWILIRKGLCLFKKAG